MTELEQAQQEVARLEPAYKAFLATLSWDDEMKRSLGEMPDRESPEIEKQFKAAQARWLACKKPSHED